MFALIDAIALPFLYACLSCAVAAAAIWALLAPAARVWPVLAANRSVWLLSQAAIAAVFVLALLPQRAQLSVLPTIEVERAALALPAGAVPPLAAGAEDADGAADEPLLIELAAQAWLALYAAGLLLAMLRAARAYAPLRTLLAASRTVDANELSEHPGFAAQPVRRFLQRGLQVLEIDAPISPMLSGRRLLLPRHLRHFDAEQQRLIVAHELTHYTRRDPLVLAASLLLQTVFWFNPVLRLLGQRLHWAQELGCDREVLAGRPPQQRRHYAAALVSQLKMQHASVGAMAFGCAAPSTLRERVGLIRDDGLRRLGAAGKAAVAMALAALLAASALLQPAFAWRGAAPAPAAVAPAPADWQAPLDSLRVTSFYGAPRKTGRPHRGIDFAARTGTPVRAVADGAVVESTDLVDGGEVYGKVVVIEHAGGLRSMYAHLDQRGVRKGDAVKAGQAIGTAGATGLATGPHLHLEVFEAGARIDPQRLIPGLDAHATRTALRLRPAASQH